MPLTPLLEKLLAGRAPCSVNSFEILQENLKNQRDSFKKGSQIHAKLARNFDREFLNENFVTLSSCTFF